MRVRIAENLRKRGIIFRSVRKNYGVDADVVAENLKNPVSEEKIIRQRLTSRSLLNLIVPYPHHQTYNGDDYNRTKVCVAISEIMS